MRKPSSLISYVHFSPRGNVLTGRVSIGGTNLTVTKRILIACGNRPCTFALYSPILISVWNLPETRLCDYTIRCKGCGENIPAPVQTMPDTWIIAECPLCEKGAAICHQISFVVVLSYELPRSR